MDDLTRRYDMTIFYPRVKIGSFELVVIKTNRTLNKIFTAVLTILVVLNTINMGAYVTFYIATFFKFVFQKICTNYYGALFHNGFVILIL